MTIGFCNEKVGKFITRLIIKFYRRKRTKHKVTNSKDLHTFFLKVMSLNNFDGPDVTIYVSIKSRCIRSAGPSESKHSSNFTHDSHQPNHVQIPNCLQPNQR